LNCSNISQLYCIFDQINVALVSIRVFFQKHKKNLINPTTAVWFTWFKKVYTDPLYALYSTLKNV